MTELLAATLLRDIVNCPNVRESRADSTLACHKIISSQDNPEEPFQVPEPWTGFLESAPILFVGSNPSISYTEDYPTATPLWPEGRTARFFTHRFHDGWVRDGRYGRFRNGEYAKHRTSYWSSVRQRAIELLQRTVTPGEDYCLTEVVHCKSRKQIGVSEAAAECSSRYLRRILSAAGAKVVVVMGAFAAEAVTSQVRLLGSGPILDPAPQEQLQAVFAFVPHPAAFGPKEFRGLLGEDGVNRIRATLR